MLLQNIIKHFCEKNNIKISDSAQSAFDTLTRELLEYNSHTNLTAVRDEYGVYVKHHADSLGALAFGLIPEGAKVIDVGCGAGFPGLPLKVARDDIDISFLDSTAKKLKFTEKAADTLGFSATFLPLRAEDAAGDMTHREQYDVAVSRAMANLPVLCELALPFVKVGGKFIAYKSAKAADISDPESELSRAMSGITKLGGKVSDVFYYDLCDYFPDEEPEDKRHCLIVIEKVKKTDKAYPRRYAQILKKPL